MTVFNKIRALRADEIECRVGIVSAKGCSLLLYKDARCDKRILDEVFGATNWQDKYELINGVLFCSVGVYDDNKQDWVWKQDCGVESNTEKEKGQASDAFKRACFNWGIGRELYTKLFIWLNVPTKQVDFNGRKKWELVDKYEKWSVKEIETDNENEKIKSITIVDENGKIVYPTTKKPIIQQGKEFVKEMNDDNHTCPTCGKKMVLGKDGKTYYCVDCWKKNKGL